MSVDLPQHFADEMGALLGPDFPTEVGLAVSGGGDSMAMLHLAAGWARVYGVTLKVATVDHGLRVESATEATMVADECRGLGLRHNTLKWQGWDGNGNLQDAARQARFDLLSAWSGTCRYVLMAHTQDDQAETVLMRLIRGSGVDGLAGMAVKRVLPDMTILRPLLGVQRKDLRHYCQVLKIPFVDDPSNDDPRFDRVKMRRLIGQQGLDTATLAKTAQQMARAREALTQRAMECRARAIRTDFSEAGYIAFDHDAMAEIEEETRLRIIAEGLCDVARNPYRPRLSALEDAVEVALSGGTATLHGCLLIATKGQIVIIRELQAVTGCCSTRNMWDGRWELDGPHAPELLVGALGDALSDCSNWRSTGHPRHALRASPAIWHDDRLIAAPLAGLNNGWMARIVAK